MQKAALFIDELRQDLKGFFYWCLVFTLFRLAFIFAFKEQLGGTEAATIGQALLLGLRLSLKTCGFIMLGSALFASLPKIFCSHWPARRVRLAWNCFWLLFFSAAFMARLPYYEIFHSAFDMMVINGLYDDKGAILSTAVEEYGLFPRLGGALFIAALLSFSYWRLLGHREAAPHLYSKTKTALAFFFIPVFWIFCRYGGAFDYKNSISWENCGRLPINLLNEAVLDDGQALYRVYSVKRFIDKAAKVDFGTSKLKEFIAAAGGDPADVSLDKRFTRVVSRPKLAKQPQDIVLILGESFGAWPFLERFKALGLVQETAALAAGRRGASLNKMLANGSGTISAVVGVVTGLPEVGIYVSNQPETYKEIYRSGVGTIMRELGYKTVFWYGGFPEWQNIEKFALAQAFDEFHCANEMIQTGGNAWGCPDKELFRHIKEYMEKEGGKTFHLVLTSSNHPPYTVDIDKEGFPREKVRSKLTEDIYKNEKTLTELGHIWYADMTMGKFVKEAEALRPDTLFIITGDHSERFDFAKEEDIRTRSLIPCIFYGQGVKKAWFDDKSCGSQMQLPGTLAELLGPPGFTYCAYYPSLFARPAFVFNHNLYASPTELRKLDLQTGPEAEKVKALRKVAAWRAVKGDRAE